MRIAVLALALLLGTAQAQESALHALVGLRIHEDLSGVCIAAQRIAPGAGGFTVDSTTRCAGADRSLPARPGYRFAIGVLSRGFTGVLLAEMIERGEVTLDDPLQQFLPQGVAAPTFDGRAITLRDLVTHTAGLPALPTRLEPSPSRTPDTRLDADVVYGSLADLALEQTPGARYRDSDWGFMLLSEALGRRAGKPFDALLRERVLAPLGMHDTLVTGNANLLPGHASSGRTTPARELPAPFAGAGGLRATAADMATFARALLGDVPAGAPESLRRALANTPRKLRDVNRNVAVAMAWRVIRLGEREYIALDDGAGGFSSAVVIDRQDRTAAVVLADATGGFEDLAFRMVAPGAPMSAPRRAVPVDATAAQALVGRYELRPGVVLEVTFADGKLYLRSNGARATGARATGAQATGEPHVELRQDSRGDFHPTEGDALLRFARDDEGKVSGVSVFESGGMARGKRIVTERAAQTPR